MQEAMSTYLGLFRLGGEKCRKYAHVKIDGLLRLVSTYDQVVYLFNLRVYLQ